MKATLMLCDHVAEAGGKLYIAGGGWSIIGPAVGPTGVAVLIAVPWDQTNRKHHFRLSLEREDGQPVEQLNELGQASPLAVEADFEVGRPAGLTPGTPLDVPLPLNCPALPLEPGARYRWVFEVDDDRRDDWTLPFSVRRSQKSHETSPPSE